MNKKDILEIRKQFSHENCCITRICGCYVDAEKEKRMEFREAFLSLPEEETFKYFDLFKQTLAGSVGKNLLTLEFPLEQEQIGGTQDALLRLRDSKLKDDDLLNEFYDKVIEHYDFGENYLILLIHAVYDIPGKASDGKEMFDASEDVYEHILCSICPVSLSKPGLCYDSQDSAIKDRTRDWIVNPPQKGFLFPAFNDRTADIHEVLYFSKKPEDLMPGFVDGVLGCDVPLPASVQKDMFHAVIADTLGEDCDYETVRDIHEKLNVRVEECDAPEPLELGKPDIRNLFEESGVDTKKLALFDRMTPEVGTTLLAANIANKTTTITAPALEIKVDTDSIYRIETKVIDGRKYLVIPVDSHIEVNGLAVKVKGEDAL